MKPLALSLVVAVSMGVGLSMAADAHNVPWRAGESRLKGFGHCAKGPCMMITDWSASKPHRHVGGMATFDHLAPAFPVLAFRSKVTPQCPAQQARSTPPHSQVNLK